MMPVIRVSGKTMERLAKFARPFVDKPEDVVSKALDALEAQGGLAADKAPREKLPTKRRVDLAMLKTPQKEFEQPLIDALAELGGKATLQQVKAVLEKNLEMALKPGDYEPVSTGDERWWNAVCWVRSDLVSRGIMKSGSERGVWELA